MRKLLKAMLLLLAIQPVLGQATQTTIPPPAHHRKAAPLSNNRHYTNSSGNVVHAPARAPSVPAGASARCRDGSYSFSQHRSGTCSHHGGVASWL